MSRVKQIFTPTAFKIGLLATIFSLIIYGMGIPFFQAMELKAFDSHFLYRGEVKPGNEVVIVAIDQKSVDALGRWPWPRTRIAELIERLDAYGAKVVALDIVFSEPDESLGLSTIKGLKNRLKDKGQDVRSEIEAVEKAADSDARLASALKKSPSAILGYFFFTSKEEIKHLEEKQAAYLIPSRFTSIRYIEKGTPSPDILTAAGVEENIKVLSDAATNFGYFNTAPDSDGTVRWVPLAIKYGDNFYPHLALEAVRKYLASPPLILNAARYGVDSIQIGHRNVPTDERGRLLINYRGDQKTFPHYSLSDVLKGDLPADAFKDKIVLIGATAVGIYDMRVTPFSGAFPGVEIHANVIDNILKGDFINRPDWIVVFDIAAMLLLGIALAIVIPKIRAVYAALFTIALAVLYIILNNYAFDTFRIWLTVVYPVNTIVLVSSCVITFQFMTEEKRKREIKNAFSHYVSPSHINEILKDPHKLVLGGEEKRLTVLFSDIRGFTTISEGLKPQELVKLMNDYLTPMTEMVLKNGGTVDKYIGDAIMAFWGAPIWQEDHPARACKTALDMMERLAELSVEWKKKGRPEIDIGIGLSTGNLTVGNMGSTTRFDYTVMGDAVNLGSRLEGMNKEYGTHIIVPKYTYEDVKTEFIFRHLDLIRVKGKKIPINIYELMGDKTDSGGLKEVAGLFEAGLKSYTERDWDKAEGHFQDVLRLRPEDGPSRVFLSRVEKLRETDLSDDWDGVFVMTKK